MKSDSLLSEVIPCLRGLQVMLMRNVWGSIWLVNSTQSIIDNISWTEVADIPKHLHRIIRVGSLG